VPTVDGGRVPALEILVNTGRVAERIEDPDTTSEIKEVIKDGAFYGMVTFDQWLLRLIQEGTVSVADAMQAVSSRTTSSSRCSRPGSPCPCSSGHDPSPPRRCDTEPGEDADGRPDRRRCDPATLVGRGVERSDRRRRVRWCDVGDRDRGPSPGPLPLPTTITPDMPGWYVHANG
jgi:hypothetical protein